MDGIEKLTDTTTYLTGGRSRETGTATDTLLRDGTEPTS